MMRRLLPCIVHSTTPESTRVRTWLDTPHVRFCISAKHSPE